MKNARQTESRGKRNFDRAISADAGSPFLVRFMGVITPRNVRYTEEQLREMSAEDVTAHALEIGARIVADQKLADLVKNVLLRYEQREPAISARHYIGRNKGQQGRQCYVNCADAERVLSGEGDYTCRYCYAIDHLGDKGIGRAQGIYYFSAWDYRKVHQIRGAKETDKKEYEECTVDSGVCKHCSWNRSRKPDAPDYRPLFNNGMRYFRLPGMHAEHIMACERRVKNICRSCGIGKLKPIGAVCPREECCEEYDFDALVLSGWAPEDPQPITCGSCGETVVPEPLLACSRCSDPVPTALHDVMVLCEKSGEDKKQTWSFAEQLPVEPLDLANEIDAKVLAAELPNFEEIGKGDSVSEQLRNIGIRDDPMAEDIPDAPVVRSAGRAAVVPTAGGVKKKAAAAPPAPPTKAKASFLRRG